MILVFEYSIHSNIWNCTVFLPFLELCKSIGVSVNIILLKITRPLFPIPFSAIRCNLVMGWVAQFEFSSKYVVPENDPSSWFLTPIQNNVSSIFLPLLEDFIKFYSSFSLCFFLNKWRKPCALSTNHKSYFGYVVPDFTHP